MKYRHGFHAGNYGDVWKHTLLLLLWRMLQRKEKGLLYLDTHAGGGAYDLLAPAPGGPVGRLPEWPQGIGRVWAAPGPLPPALAAYVELVREFNARRGSAGGNLRFYPGSPWIAALARRPQDRLLFREQQAEAAAALRAELADERRVTVECGDGYQAVRAALPPAERRALVLIDPPFEDQDEFAAVLGALREGLRRFSHGVYAVWYPLTQRADADAFRAALLHETPPPTFWTELTVAADPQVRLKGCGLLVINPPWQFADEVESLQPTLAALLGAEEAGGTARSGWLVREPGGLCPPGS
jgi:23S rRNA (adenine2030-N6)-methyltransferase